MEKQDSDLHRALGGLFEDAERARLTRSIEMAQKMAADEIDAGNANDAEDHCGECSGCECHGGGGCGAVWISGCVPTCACANTHHCSCSGCRTHHDCYDHAGTSTADQAPKPEGGVAGTDAVSRVSDPVVRDVILFVRHLADEPAVRRLVTATQSVAGEPSVQAFIAEAERTVTQLATAARSVWQEPAAQELRDAAAVLADRLSEIAHHMVHEPVVAELRSSFEGWVRELTTVARGGTAAQARGPGSQSQSRVDALGVDPGRDRELERLITEGAARVAQLGRELDAAAAEKAQAEKELAERMLLIENLEEEKERKRSPKTKADVQAQIDDLKAGRLDADSSEPTAPAISELVSRTEEATSQGDDIRDEMAATSMEVADHALQVTAGGPEVETVTDVDEEQTDAGEDSPDPSATTESE